MTTLFYQIVNPANRITKIILLKKYNKKNVCVIVSLMSSRNKSYDHTTSLPQTIVISQQFKNITVWIQT